MRLLRPIAVCLTLAVVTTGTANAQRGLGLARGFTGVGLGNWALYEGGIDSLAAWYQLTEEQRGQLGQISAQFRSENADALERWQQMQLEIQQLWTANQQPTQAAIYNIGQKYGHPGLELQPALDQLQIQSAALLTPGQSQFSGRRSFVGIGGGRGMRAVGRGSVSRGYNAGYRGCRGRRGFNRQLGWPPPQN